MEFKDYYQTLGVDKDASQDDIQKAYRKLARKHHPDVNKDPDSETKFKEIGEAYAVLKDPEKRKKYDRFGMAWDKAQTQGDGAPPNWENIDFDFDLGGGRTRVDFGGRGGMGGMGGEGFSSFFDMLFGGGGFGGGAPGGPGGGFQGQRTTRGARAQAARGADTEAPISLSLEDAAQGGQRELVLTDPSTGRRKTVSVNIPAGLKPGQRIRLAGQGREGYGGERGDLYLKIDVTPSADFRLEGVDVHTELPVTPWEAVLGGKARLKTLDGDVTVKIPPGSSSGQKIRLRSKGYPKTAGNGKERGDLYATLRIVVPKQASAEEKELYEKLADVSSFEARS